MITVEQHGIAFVVQANDGENRFNRTSIDQWHTALDHIETVDGPLALVTTGFDKFYSNGLDLDWLMSDGRTDTTFIEDVHRLLGRVLNFPAITVAAVNGHAFAGGAMLATAHDYIVMREDRGYWCLPEVDLGLPLTTAMYQTVAAHLPTQTLRDAILSGRRYDGSQMLAAGIAHELASVERVLPRAIEIANELGAKSREVIVEHKRLLLNS